MRGVLAIVDTLVSNNPLLFAEILSKHCWGQIAKARMAPLAIIKNFNVLPDGSLACRIEYEH